MSHATSTHGTRMFPKVHLGNVTPLNTILKMFCNMCIAKVFLCSKLHEANGGYILFLPHYLFHCQSTMKTHILVVGSEMQWIFIQAVLISHVWYAFWNLILRNLTTCFSSSVHKFVFLPFDFDVEYFLLCDLSDNSWSIHLGDISMFYSFSKLNAHLLRYPVVFLALLMPGLYYWQADMPSRLRFT